MSGRVLQGYFCIERFRGQRSIAGPGGFWADKAPRPGLMASHGTRRGAAQAKTGAKQLGVPRPDLLPAAMSGSTAQAKPATNSAWPGAPRPELLPGMGKPRVSARAAQLQGQAGVVSSPISEDRLRLIGPGKPLEPKIRAHMESFFEADFSGVRVHEGPAAQAMGALAFTLGETLYFAPGLYDPSTREGVELLGHELAHVVQQRDGRVSNPHGRGVAIVQDPALEAEADAMGRRAANAMWAKGGVGLAASRVSVQLAGRPAVQRSGAIQRMILLNLFSKSSSSNTVKSGVCIVTTVASAGAFEVVVTQKLDHQIISAGEGTVNDGYFLPWKNGNYTEAILDLSQLQYFFTAPLSGCSIWYKYLDKGILAVRHEARTNHQAHLVHQQANFTLLFDSNAYTSNWQQDRILKIVSTENDDLLRVATLFNVYGIVTKGSGMTFVIQEQQSTTSSKTETNTFKLIKETKVSV